jgi:outer membrane protein with beta-barrel domain
MLEKKLLLTIAATMLFATLDAQPARAQTETPRVEIGAHFSLIRLPRPQFDFRVCFDECPPLPPGQLDTFRGAGAAPGVGGRITFNFNKHVAVEGEFNFFPKDLLGAPNPPQRRRISLSGQQTQGLFGLKAGIRSSRAGIFGKVRPGYMRFWQAHEGIVCIAVFPAPFGCELARRGRTGFALDLGGVVEFYPSRHTVVRFDLGDTVINFQGPFFEGRSLTTHSLQFNAGVGFRF